MTEEVLLRIYVGENDKHDHRPVFEVVLDLLRMNGIAGATVLRGIAGYGAGSVVHTQKILDLTHDLPVIIEAIDSPETFEKILPLLDDVLKGGLATMVPVRTIRYGGATR